jgi:RND superfamily putative drug exporter
MRASAIVAAIDRWVGRRRAIVLVPWLALVAVALPLALSKNDHLTGGGFQVPGSQSDRAEAEVQASVPLIFRPNVFGAVLVAPRGTPAADYRAALAALDKAARATPKVNLDPAARQVAVFLARTRPGQPVVVPLQLSLDTFHAPDAGREMRKRLRLNDGGGRFGAVQMHLVGGGALWAGMVDLTKDDLSHAERIGFPLILLVLIGVFGALAAAALPLAMGGVSVLVTLAVIDVLARHTLMSFYAPNMASMIGLGVAVDYSLFVVVRYREELATGVSREQARATAMATSGTAVVFSGAAVVIALAGLLLVPTAAIRSMALGAIIVVLVSMLACVTLLPALLTIVGGRLGRPRGGTMFRRLAEGVTGRPVLSLVAALLVLLALAAPVLGLKTGDGALRQFPKGNETRQGFEAAAKVRGRGDGTPLKVLVPTSGLDRSVTLLRADNEIVKTGVRTRTDDKRYDFLVVTMRHDADSPQAKALVKHLRAILPRGSLIGGDTAAEVDFNHAITGSLWKIALWTLVATMVLLLVMLRSVPLALQAVLANILSVAASFGVLTIVFVHHGAGSLDTVTIPVILAVVFGLSMDYEVFLLSRIRELHEGGQDTRTAVLEGIAGSARTITGAALVMVVVFTCFAVTGVPVIAEIGLGAAVAIAIDATLVRLVVVPATLTLLGDRTWWAPRLRRRRPAAA